MGVFTALLDTNVLWPSLLRDFLLSLAVEGLYRPVWSEAILEELHDCEVTKLTRRGVERSEARARAVQLIEQMRTHFDDAVVTGWEGLDGTYGLPDPDDEHVLAAAVLGGAGAIVTWNTKDFPDACLPVGIRAFRPPEGRRRRPCRGLAPAPPVPTGIQQDLGAIWRSSSDAVQRSRGPHRCDGQGHDPITQRYDGRACVEDDAEPELVF